MDPTFGQGARTRSPESITPQPISMPGIPVPHPHEEPLYNSSAPLQIPDYGPVDESHDYAFDPEEHNRQSYYDQPYQTAPQDIPLLGRAPSHEPLYDPHEENIPSIPYQDSRQSLYAGDGEPLSPVPSGIEPTDGQQHSEGKVGHLVYDCPVPPKLLKSVQHTGGTGRDEFTHMRYTAATCDPADFAGEHFTLRQQLFGRPRRTELLIVVTMYNEDDVLFARTMIGVFQNIEYMCSMQGQHKGLWGTDGWKNIVVCVVSDGRAKIDIRTRAVLTALGAYQHGVAREEVNNNKVTSHIYEYTTKVGIGLKNGIVETKPGMQCPVQLLFCLKEQNQKKINSHRWALQAFGEALQPNVVVLLDAGTRPGPKSIYQLWRAFEIDEKCGGACGEIKAMLGTGGKNLLNPLVAAQNFEYKMSNILDKPMESAFGFISVLPGAFSAYRFAALQNDARGDGPLEKYFAGEKHHLDAGIFTKNMYLAEDRILCFELVAKRKSSWVLTYVCTATGETDVPEQMPELIKQRRRWLNGSFFAAVYALAHFYQIFRSSHSMMRKVMFLVEFMYQLISMVFAWFAVANFFLVFRILTTALGAPELLGRAGEIISVAIEWVYLGSLVTCFVLSLGNTPDGSRRFYLVMVYTWAAIMMYLLFASVFITVKSVESELHDGIKFTLSKLFTNSIFFTLIVSLLSTYVLWIFSSVVFLDPWHIVTSSFQYMLLSPTYTNVINVYAFCNTHDVTWGTKGDDKPEKLKTAKINSDGKADEDPEFDDSDLNAAYDTALQKFNSVAPPEESKPNPSDIELNYNKAFRSYVVLAWMFCNALLVAAVLNSGGLNRLSVNPSAGENQATVKTYLLVILWSVAGLSAFKFVGSMWYLIKRIFKR